MTTQQDKLISTSKSGYFVGKGNNSGAFLVWSPLNPYKILRAHHVRVNEGSTGAIFDGLFLKSINDDPLKIDKQLDFTITTKAFSEEDVHKYEMDIGAGGGPLGMRIINDEMWNIPLLECCLKDTQSYKQIALSHRRNMHIVSVNGIEPITAEYANLSWPLQSRKVMTLTIYLHLKSDIH